MRIKMNDKLKYSNKITQVDGIKFASIQEAEHYSELKLMRRSGEIKWFDIQPRVRLTDARILYIPDFIVMDKEGHCYWVDVKGFETPEFKLKKKLWEFYGPGELRIIGKKKLEIIKSCKKELE